jgi:hypothetical protein
MTVFLGVSARTYDGKYIRLFQEIGDQIFIHSSLPSLATYNLATAPYA